MLRALSTILIDQFKVILVLTSFRNCVPDPIYLYKLTNTCLRVRYQRWQKCFMCLCIGLRIRVLVGAFIRCRYSYHSTFLFADINMNATTVPEVPWNNYNGCYSTCQAYPPYHSSELTSINLDHSTNSHTGKLHKCTETALTKKIPVLSINRINN